VTQFTIRSTSTAGKHSSANNPSSHDRGSASLHPVCTPRDQHSASAFRMGFCESVANREYTCVSTT